MTNLNNLTNLIKSGAPNEDVNSNNGADYFDFRSMGESARNMIYTGRIQNFIDEVEKIIDSSEEINVLDMGGGSGIIAIEIARAFPNAHALIFDQKNVIPITKENILKYGVEERVGTKEGNFVTDDIGSNYDLIIASGVMDFAGDLNIMAAKLYSALKSNGYLIVTTHGINDDYTFPAHTILGWLSSRLNGLDILKTDRAICESFYNNGFIEAKESRGGFHLLQKKERKKWM